jgi:hypothetical protein
MSIIPYCQYGDYLGRGLTVWYNGSLAVFDPASEGSGSLPKLHHVAHGGDDQYLGNSTKGNRD